MKEIGGYIELDHYRGKMLHETAILLNCGRNALAYLIEVYKIKKLVIPKFMCDSCNKVLANYKVEVRYYSIGIDFCPESIKLAEDEWLYVVNFYGQLDNSYLQNLQVSYPKIIIDNSQAYFQLPINDTHTIYTCRKFFGVPDGAILYTKERMGRELETDISYNRMNFLLGRYEKSASEFYPESVLNNQLFNNEPLKKMSLLTRNLLRGLDYKHIEEVRTNNFAFLHKKFNEMNKLKVKVPLGAFMYPLYIKDGAMIREKLQKMKIYIPILWQEVLNKCTEDELEYDMAMNILPLPIDQRYGRIEMEYLVKTISEIVNNEKNY